MDTTPLAPPARLAWSVLLPALLAALVVAVPRPALAVATTVADDVHVRVNVGGPRVDAEPAWQADTRRSPSTLVTGVATRHSRTKRTVRAASSPETAPAAVYATSRFDRGAAGDGGELGVSMAVPAGRYEVRLHLAETYGGSFSTGARVFDVVAQDEVVLADVDVFAEAGARRGMVKTFLVDVSASDARLDVELHHGSANNPRLNGIEVIGLRTVDGAETLDVDDDGDVRQPHGYQILHVTPEGAGLRDGSSWAQAATLAQLPSLVEQAAPGTEVWLHAGLGDYDVTRQVGLSAGGVPGQPITIRGATADGSPARATIAGTRAFPYDPVGARGKEVFRLLDGADHLAFRDIDFRDVGNGAFRIGGDITDLTITGSTATNVRRFIENARSGESTTASVSGLVVRDVEVHGFSKSAIRLRYDSNDIHLVDVLGDSQRQDFDRFAIGVHLAGTVHDVLLERVTMRNSHDTVTHAGGYWNGDGFATERGVQDVEFRDTVASGSTDAGYDLKSSATSLVRPVAFDNKRNYRFWYDGITMQDCLGRDPHHRGGIGSQAQVHLSADTVASISGCTFTDDHPSTRVYDLEERATLTVADTTAVHHAEARLTAEDTDSVVIFE